MDQFRSYAEEHLSTHTDSYAAERYLGVMQKALEDGVAAEYHVRGMNLSELEAFAQKRFWHPKYLPFRKHT